MCVCLWEMTIIYAGYANSHGSVAHFALGDLRLARSMVGHKSLNWIRTMLGRIIHGCVVAQQLDVCKFVCVHFTPACTYTTLACAS